MRRPTSLDLAFDGGTSIEPKNTLQTSPNLFPRVKTKKLDILGTFIHFILIYTCISHSKSNFKGNIESNTSFLSLKLYFLKIEKKF